MGTQVLRWQQDCVPEELGQSVRAREERCSEMRPWWCPGHMGLAGRGKGLIPRVMGSLEGFGQGSLVM